MPVINMIAAVPITFMAALMQGLRITQKEKIANTKGNPAAKNANSVAHTSGNTYKAHKKPSVQLKAEIMSAASIEYRNR